MCQHLVQIELEKLENEVRDLIMLEDSAHGTVCAIHSAIHTTGNFPQSNHHMLRICPVSRCPNNSRIPISERKLPYRSRSPSPKRQLCLNQSRIRQHRKPLGLCQTLNNRKGSSTSDPVTSLNVEKTFSCPGKMCICLRQTSSLKTNLTSKSSVRIDSKIANSILCTDEIVNELKGEIERVKHQLYHIASTKAKSEVNTLHAPDTSTSKVQSQTYHTINENELGKLKIENKRIKRELEVKKKLLENTKKDIEKARDILSDYEMKVTLLHQQAIKSSKAIKASKERFCKCLKDKEEKIQALRIENESLQDTVFTNRSEFSQLVEENTKLKRAFEDTCFKCAELNESNQKFDIYIAELKQKLEQSINESQQYKNSVESIEKKLEDMNCACRKLATKYKKQKDSYENQLKTKEEIEKKLSQDILNLSSKLLDVETDKRLNLTEVEKVQDRCLELESKLTENESLMDKCKDLEEECKKHCEALMKNEMMFQKSQEEMQKLIQELTTVVDSNKKTLLEMSETNKAQEILIKTQSLALMSKEEQLRVTEKQSEDFKTRSQQLEREIQKMKQSLSEPCSKDACLCISRELQKIKQELSEERDNHLMSEKIIKDQSQTIIHLQSQVKEKIFEVTKAQSDTKYLETQIQKINEKLQIKHRELNRQINEKENLAEKLKILEKQKQQLTEEIEDFQEMLHKFKDTCGENENQRDILRNLKRQIENQKKEWHFEKEIMVKEKEKAISAAKFATQKLLDTVADFQRQVDAQKRVQLLLTKMLHEKDDQLKIVTSKISDINSLTTNLTYQDSDYPMRELFKNQKSERYTASEPNTTSPSFYSSCTSCKRSFDLPFQPIPPAIQKICKASCSKPSSNNNSGHYKCNRECLRVQELFEMIKDGGSSERNDDQPIRDFNLN